MKGQSNIAFDRTIESLVVKKQKQSFEDPVLKLYLLSLILRPST